MIFTFVLFALLVLSESAVVNLEPKCSVKDGICQKNLAQNVLNTLVKSGIPEYDIPQLDPMVIKDVSINAENVIQLNFIEGAVKGVSSCQVVKILPNVDKRDAKIEITCDKINIKSTFKVQSDNPEINSLIGLSKLRGEGEAEVEFEKLNIKMEIHYEVIKKDGDIYLDCKPMDMKYEYAVLGESRFKTTGIRIGDQDMSALVEKLMNENSKMLIDKYGNLLMDKALEFIHLYLRNFFSHVPTKDFLIEDMSAYVK